MKNIEKYKTLSSSPSKRPGADEVQITGTSLYIHIPFCKLACHYCDFHFSTSMKKKDELVDALCKELLLRKKEILGEIGTIYFGGGTPSLLTQQELQQISATIYSNFEVAQDAEITLEANPDDLTEEKLKVLTASPVNRLSIGVQSFFEEDLKIMNRAHNAAEAEESIQLAKKYFENISIDLIYGIPEMSNERWKLNLDKALKLQVPHISSYALTVEPKTALKKLIEKGRIAPVDEDTAEEHYRLMIETLENAGFENYEFSNFGKAGYFSRNNTAYWFGKPYVGIGPSAHSFDGNNRKWNVNNNILYIKSIKEDRIPAETENLSTVDKYNELVMTRLRTKWGISLQEVAEKFGEEYKKYLLKEARQFLTDGFLELKGDQLSISRKGKFLSDGIAADLFFLNL